MDGQLFVHAGLRAVSPATKRIQDPQRVVPFQGFAPVEKLDRIHAPLPGQGLVDRRAGPSKPLGKPSHRQPELLGSILQLQRQSLIRTPLEWLLRLKRLGFFC